MKVADRFSCYFVDRSMRNTLKTIHETHETHEKIITASQILQAVSPQVLQLVLPQVLALV